MDVFGSFTVDKVSVDEREAFNAMRDEIAKAIQNKIHVIVDEARYLLRQALFDSEEYKSLLAGQLREHFGLPDAQSMVNSVVEAVVASVQASSDNSAFNSLGGIRIEILSDNFAEALNASGASYYSVTQDRVSPNGILLKQGGSRLIPWLQWLLFEGDSIILASVDINFSRASRAASRTGRAIMVRTGSSRFGAGRSPNGWGVPSEYAGTSSNNWLTRVMTTIEDPLQQLIQRELERI